MCMDASFENFTDAAEKRKWAIVVTQFLRSLLIAEVLHVPISTEKEIYIRREIY